MRLSPKPTNVQGSAKTPTTPTVWRLWVDSLGLRDGEKVAYRKGSRITGAIEAHLSCAEQNNDYPDISALLRGGDYDIEARVCSVLYGEDEYAIFTLSVLDFGVLAYTKDRFHSDEDFEPRSPVSAIASLRLDRTGVGNLGSSNPCYDHLIHTWEVVALHRPVLPAGTQSGQAANLRYSLRLEEVEEVTLEAFNWETFNAGPVWLFDCRLIEGPVES